MAQPATARVFVAADAEMDERMKECLPGHELHFVRTLHQAMAELRRDGYQLLVIELTFDESRMFELLQHVRTLPRYRDVPVMCVYGDHQNLSDAVVHNIDVAVKALGGMAFLDLRAGSIAYPADCQLLGQAAGNSPSHPS